jgi:hypothetical protein
MRARDLVHVREQPLDLVVLMVVQGVVLLHVSTGICQTAIGLPTVVAIASQYASCVAHFWSVQNVFCEPFVGKGLKLASAASTSPTRKSAPVAPRPRNLGHSVPRSRPVPAGEVQAEGRVRSVLAGYCDEAVRQTRHSVFPVQQRLPGRDPPSPHSLPRAPRHRRR